MANYTKSFNFRNGVQVDDTNFVISPDGLVGIGTSQPNKELDVYGDSRVSGIASFNHIGVVGIVTIGDNIKLDASTGIIEATSFSGNLSGATGIVAIATAGWIQNNIGLTTTGQVGIATTEFNNYELQVGNDPIGNIGVGITQGVLTVSGLTTTNDLYVSGVSTFIGDINADGGVDVDGHTELDDVNVSGASTFTGAIDANGDLDVDGHTELDDVNVSSASTFVGVSTFKSEVSIGGSIFVSGISTFTGAIDANSDVDIDGHTELDDVNVAGVSTFNDDIVIKNGSDIKVNWDKADNKFTFSQNVKAVFDDGDGDTDPGLEISHDGTNSLIKDYGTTGGTGNFTLKTTNSTFQVLGNDTESMIVANPDADVQLFDNNVLKFNTISTGASVYGQINVARLNGGTDTLSTKHGALRYGNETGTFGYSTRKSLDLLNYDTGNINFYLDGSNTNSGIGSFHWHKGPDSPLMTLNADGNLGIGITEPEYKLHVSGISTFTGNITAGNDLLVANNLTVNNILSVPSGITADVIGDVTGRLYSSSGFSTAKDFEAIRSVGIGTTGSAEEPFKVNNTSDNEFIIGWDGSVRTPNVTINSDGFSVGVGKTLSVGTDSATAKGSVDFKDAGAIESRFMVPPKVTTAERGNLADVVAGAMIYNTSLDKLQVYTGSSWETVTSS